MRYTLALFCHVAPTLSLLLKNREEEEKKETTNRKSRPLCNADFPDLQGHYW